MCVINGFFVVWPVRYVCCVFGGSFIPRPAPPPFPPAPRKSESSHLVPSSIKQSRQWCAATGDNTHGEEDLAQKRGTRRSAHTPSYERHNQPDTRCLYTHTYTHTYAEEHGNIATDSEKKATTTHTFTSTAVARDFFAAPPC